MFQIAIVGSGPTAVYTLRALIDGSSPLDITVFERTGTAGVGMPYRQGTNGGALLANIASVELPPVMESLEAWLRSRSELGVESMGVDIETFDDRTFLPRVVLGTYFRDQFVRVVELGTARGHKIKVLTQHNVTDIQTVDDRISVATEIAGGLKTYESFDRVVIATGHEVADSAGKSDSYFSSPYPTWLLQRIEASRVAILGTSLSGIDAAVSVAQQHGEFEGEAPALSYKLRPESQGLQLAMMSRNGLLPEADFYCPIPYEPLDIFTADAIESEVQAGAEGLLDRLFNLFRLQITACDPDYSRTIDLIERTADTYPESYFASRLGSNPIECARSNLAATDADRKSNHTVPWKYAVLRMHEVFEHAVRHFGRLDRDRFHNGMRKVFIDNYAAIPPESVRRLIALHDAGVLSLVALGSDYEVRSDEIHRVVADGRNYTFDVLIEATGEAAGSIDEMPFPGVKEAFATQLKKRNKRFDPEALPKHGGVYLAALPYLLIERPFVQGLVSCHEIGTVIAAEIRNDVEASGNQRNVVDIRIDELAIA